MQRIEARSTWANFGGRRPNLAEPRTHSAKFGPNSAGRMYPNMAKCAPSIGASKMPDSAEKAPNFGCNRQRLGRHLWPTSVEIAKLWPSPGNKWSNPSNACSTPDPINIAQIWPTPNSGQTYGRPRAKFGRTQAEIARKRALVDKSGQTWSKPGHVWVERGQVWSRKPKKMAHIRWSANKTTNCHMSTQYLA